MSKKSDHKIESGRIAITNRIISELVDTSNKRRAPAIICDIDGTIALMNGRSPYDFSKVDTDMVDAGVCIAVNAMVGFYDIYPIFLSGRDDSCYDKTHNWIKKYIIASKSFSLIMRKTGDKRDDAIVKNELYHEHIEPHYNVIAVFDDRNRVVDMWRKELNLSCFQVYYGDF